MTISAGNPKCFELSKALWKDGATVSVTSGESTKNNLIDFNKLTRWQSIGTDDTITETIIITFQEVATISSLLLLNHNWKSFEIHPVTSAFILDHIGDEILDYVSDELEDDGGILSFQNVTSSYNSTPQNDILETEYAFENSYYEFDPVYCAGLKIDITLAQELHDVPNQEKFCFRIIPTVEVDNASGTFASFPDIQRPTDYYGINSRMINGKYRVQKQNPIFSCGVFLKTNPLQSDITLMEFLRNSPFDFLFYPSGGAHVELGQYRFSSLPYNLDDIYQMQVNRFSMGRYIRNLTSNPINMSISLLETIT